jgi:hypothetical protein
MLEAAFCKPPVTLKIVTVSRLWQIYFILILKRVTESCVKHSEASYESPIQSS